MSGVCDHATGDTVETFRVVDDARGGVDPVVTVLVIVSGSAEVDAIGSRRVEIIGELDAYLAGLVAAPLKRVGVGTGLVLDLSGVSVIDSAGLRCVERFLDDVVKDGGDVRLHDPSRAVRRLLTVLEIDRFEICEPVSSNGRIRHGTRAGPPALAHRIAASTPVGVERGLTLDTTVTTFSTDGSGGPSHDRHDVAFTVHGELDAAAVRRITCGGLSCLDRVGLVTVDLADVTIIDSAGARLIDELEKVVTKAGGRIVLRRPSRIVRRVLDVLDVGVDIESPQFTRPPTRAETTPVRRSRRSPQQPDDSHRHAFTGSGGLVWFAAVGHLPGLTRTSDARPVRVEVPVTSSSSGRRLRMIRVPSVHESSPTDTGRRLDLVDDHSIIRTADAVVRDPLHGVASSRRQLSLYQWARYQRVNERLAQATSDVCDTGDSVWIHDYPFLLAPQAIRSRRPDLTIGFSLHTPFDTDTMLDHARASEIADSLTACDLLGVQTLADVHQLETFFSRTGAVDPPTISMSPTSIDPAHTIAAADQAAMSTQACDVRQRTGSRRMIVSVDDLDHTSAIGERLAGFDLAFRRGILDPDDVHIVQIVNTRCRHVPDVHGLRLEIERFAHTLNATWISADRSPVIETHFDSIDADVTLAIMRLADIFMFTPARAGMGLAAKEFSVLTASHEGVLILSDRCGAAAELGPHCVLVDAVTPDSIADGLERASTLGAADRIRHAALRSEVVHRWTSCDWADSFLDGLEFTRSQRVPRTRRPHPHRRNRA